MFGRDPVTGERVDYCPLPTGFVKICEKCGNPYNVVNLKNIIPGVQDDLESTCPFCRKKEIDGEFQKEMESEEMQKSNRISRCEKFRIREEFYFKTLDNYNAETASQKQALEAARKVVNGDCKKLILMGGNGIGKSHLENAILYILGGIRYTAYELFALYRECYSPKARFTELQLIEKLTTAYKCFMIDEVGRTKGSEAELNFMSLLVDELHTRGKVILMNSNKIRKTECPAYLQNKENCKNCTNCKCIERYLDNDILSRLSENSIKIQMSGKDYRRQ